MTSGELGIEAEITPGMDAYDVAALAALAEDVGFDRLGISDVLLWPDTYMLQVVAAQATHRILIGSMVTNPYTRHPVVHAAALATLQEVSRGRGFLGIGVGAGLEAIGLTPKRVVPALRESISVIKRLLNGEVVDHQGEFLTVEGARLVRPPDQPVPIAIGTRSAGVARLAGEVADIVLIGARHFTQGLVAQYRGWLTEGASRAGRSLDDIEVAARVTLCVSDDGELARWSVKRLVAHYLWVLGDSGPQVAPERRAAIEAALDRSTGWYFDHDRHDDPALGELIDDDLTLQFAVAGTPEECVGQLRAIIALGFSSVSCNLAAVKRPHNTMTEGMRETLLGAAVVIAALRSPTPSSAVVAEHRR
jgi:5,10-methylenetetrahydromethanopterin reductase